AEVGLAQPLDGLPVRFLDAPAEPLLVVAGERLELRDVADVGVEAVGRDLTTSLFLFAVLVGRHLRLSALRDLSHSARPGKRIIAPGYSAPPEAPCFVS